MNTYQPRSLQVETAYQEYAAHNDVSQLSYSTNEILKSFEHWVIIPNKFPYDNIASLNHLLVSKEPLTSLCEASPEVKAEYESIIEKLSNDNQYHALIQNFTQSTTVTKQFHVHLIKWQNS